MVPENEFHHKEQPVRSATPGNLQNGPGNTGKPATTAAASAGKTEEGAAEDSGDFILIIFVYAASGIDLVASGLVCPFIENVLTLI